MRVETSFPDYWDERGREGEDTFKKAEPQSCKWHAADHQSSFRRNQKPPAKGSHSGMNPRAETREVDGWEDTLCGKTDHGADMVGLLRT
jgi:hypothetical protein